MAAMQEIKTLSLNIFIKFQFIVGIIGTKTLSPNPLINVKFTISITMRAHGHTVIRGLGPVALVLRKY